jgi:hypothetical protein
LADEVERDVREREIFLDDRRVRRPGGEPLTEDERVISEAQRELGERGIRGRAHRCLMPSGTV